MECQISPGPGSPEEGIGQPFRIPMLVLLAVPHGLHALKRKGERGLHDSKTMGRYFFLADGLSLMLKDVETSNKRGFQLMFTDMFNVCA